MEEESIGLRIDAVFSLSEQSNDFSTDLDGDVTVDQYAKKDEGSSYTLTNTTGLLDCPPGLVINSELSSLPDTFSLQNGPSSVERDSQSMQGHVPDMTMIKSEQICENEPGFEENANTLSPGWTEMEESEFGEEEEEKMAVSKTGNESDADDFEEITSWTIEGAGVNKPDSMHFDTDAQTGVSLPGQLSSEGKDHVLLFEPNVPDIQGDDGVPDKYELDTKGLMGKVPLFKQNSSTKIGEQDVLHTVDIKPAFVVLPNMKSIIKKLNEPFPAAFLENKITGMCSNMCRKMVVRRRFAKHGSMREKDMMSGIHYVSNKPSEIKLEQAISIKGKSRKRKGWFSKNSKNSTFKVKGVRTKSFKPVNSKNVVINGLTESRSPRKRKVKSMDEYINPREIQRFLDIQKKWRIAKREHDRRVNKEQKLKMQKERRSQELAKKKELAKHRELARQESPAKKESTRDKSKKSKTLKKRKGGGQRYELELTYLDRDDSPPELMPSGDVKTEPVDSELMDSSSPPCLTSTVSPSSSRWVSGCGCDALPPGHKHHSYSNNSKAQKKKKKINPLGKSKTRHTMSKNPPKPAANPVFNMIPVGGPFAQGNPFKDRFVNCSESAPPNAPLTVVRPDGSIHSFLLPQPGLQTHTNDQSFQAISNQMFSPNFVQTNIQERIPPAESGIAYNASLRNTEQLPHAESNDIPNVIAGVANPVTPTAPAPTIPNEQLVAPPKMTTHIQGHATNPATLMPNGPIVASPKITEEVTNVGGPLTNLVSVGTEQKTKFYLLRVGGKNILIPMKGEMIQPKAFVVNGDVPIKQASERVSSIMVANDNKSDSKPSTSEPHLPPVSLPTGIPITLPKLGRPRTKTVKQLMAASATPKATVPAGPVISIDDEPAAVASIPNTTVPTAPVISIDDDPAAVASIPKTTVPAGPVISIDDNPAEVASIPNTTVPVAPVISIDDDPAAVASTPNTTVPAGSVISIDDDSAVVASIPNTTVPAGPVISIDDNPATVAFIPNTTVPAAPVISISDDTSLDTSIPKTTVSVAPVTQFCDEQGAESTSTSHFLDHPLQTSLMSVSASGLSASDDRVSLALTSTTPSDDSTVPPYVGLKSLHTGRELLLPSFVSKSCKFPKLSTEKRKSRTESVSHNDENLNSVMDIKGKTMFNENTREPSEGKTLGDKTDGAKEKKVESRDERLKRLKELLKEKEKELEKIRCNRLAAERDKDPKDDT